MTPEEEARMYAEAEPTEREKKRHAENMANERQRKQNMKDQESYKKATKGYKKGGMVRGAGKATRGVRKCKIC